MAWKRASMAAALAYRRQRRDQVRLCFHLQPDRDDTDLIAVRR